MERQQGTLRIASLVLEIDWQSGRKTAARVAKALGARELLPCAKQLVAALRALVVTCASSATPKQKQCPYARIRERLLGKRYGLHRDIATQRL